MGKNFTQRYQSTEGIPAIPLDKIWKINWPCLKIEALNVSALS